jgi:hypothetical protein
MVLEFYIAMDKKMHTAGLRTNLWQNLLLTNNFRLKKVKKNFNYRNPEKK